MNNFAPRGKKRSSPPQISWQKLFLSSVKVDTSLYKCDMTSKLMIFE